MGDRVKQWITPGLGELKNVPIDPTYSSPTEHISMYRGLLSSGLVSLSGCAISS